MEYCSESGYHQITSAYALGRITIDQNIIYGSIIAVVLFGFLLLTFAGWRRSQKVILSLFIFFIVPVGIAFVISFFIPVLAPQRVLFTIPFFFGFIALGITSLKNKQHVLSTVIVTIISVVSLYMYYTNPRFQREQWREAIMYVESQATVESLAIFIFPDTFARWQWYETNKVSAIGIAPNFTVTQNDIDDFTPVIISHDKVFLFQYLTDLTDPTHTVAAFLEDSGFVQSEVRDFPGVGFIYTYEKFFAHR